MKVLLLTDVKKVGQRGTIVSVADGYAQNVLIPKKLAMPATDSVLKQAQAEEKNKVAKQQAEDARVKTLFSNVNEKTIQIKSRVNESGGLFEAIREPHIVNAIRESLKVEMPEAYVKLEESIKKAGNYELVVTGRGAQAKIYLSVVSL